MTPQEMMNDMMEAGKLVIESYKQLGQITQRALERVNTQNMAVAREYLEWGTRYVSLLANARDVRALVNEQAGFAKEFGEQMLANADAYAKLAQEVQNEFQQWAERASRAVVAEDEESAKKAVKKAA